MLTSGAAVGAYLGTLGFFLVVTLVSFYLSKSLYTGDAEKRGDTYLTARNSQGSVSIALSFFASGAGAWILFTVPEAAILGGPVAVGGYILSCLFPLLIFGAVGPYMRRELPNACTFFEYIQARYGTFVNVYCTLVSLFSMFLYLSAELTGVGSCVVELSVVESPLGPVIATALTTLTYTAIGGLPVSMATDKVQGVGVFIFTIMVSVAAYGFYELPTTSSDTFVQGNWAVVSSWGIGGSAANSFKMAFILLSACVSCGMMHSGFQQRIWAADTDKAVMRGAVGGIVLTIIFMALVAVVGMIAFANLGVPGLVSVGPDGDYLAFLAAFFIIESIPVGWQALSIVLAVLLVASSADTVQTGVAALLKPVTVGLMDAVKPGASQNAKLLVIFNFVLVACVLNAPAIALSTSGTSVLALFVLADLVCATCVYPMLMGLSPRIHPTAAGAGCMAGLAAAIAIYLAGVSGDNTDKITGEFVPMKMLLAADGLYSDTSLTAFMVVPSASVLVTLLVNIPYHLKGYRFAGFGKVAEVKVVEVASIEANKV